LVLPVLAIDAYLWENRECIERPCAPHRYQISHMGTSTHFFKLGRAFPTCEGPADDCGSQAVKNFYHSWKALFFSRSNRLESGNCRSRRAFDMCFNSLIDCHLRILSPSLALKLFQVLGLSIESLSSFWSSARLSLQAGTYMGLSRSSTKELSDFTVKRNPKAAFV